jgi:hypothetical protein
MNSTIPSRPCRQRVRWLWRMASLGVLLAAGQPRGTQGADPSDAATTAERLVEQAAQAEQSGNSGRQFALLREAVRIAPDYPLARWQLGQIEVDGDWLAVEETQRRAEADAKQASYRQLRAQYGETFQDQLALARWCRKNDLDEEARTLRHRCHSGDGEADAGASSQ